jgi:hypothetical protein
MALGDAIWAEHVVHIAIRCSHGIASCPHVSVAESIKDRDESTASGQAISGRTGGKLQSGANTALHGPQCSERLKSAQVEP